MVRVGCCRVLRSPVIVAVGDVDGKALKQILSVHQHSAPQLDDCFEMLVGYTALQQDKLFNLNNLAVVLVDAVF